MRLTGTLIFVLSIAGFAGAQDFGGRGRFPGPSVGFATLDTNGDGALDAGEIDAAAAALAKLDKDSDGRITSDEVRQSLPAGGGRGGPEGGRGEGAPVNTADDTVKTLMAFDKNGDGKLSKDELPDRMQGIFDRADQDKDGFLTPDEIRKVAAAQAGPAAGRGEREGGRGEMNFVRFDPILAAVDTDGDGALSSEEIRNAPAAIRKLDKNGDGRITREEAMPQMGRGRGR